MSYNMKAVAQNRRSHSAAPIFGASSGPSNWNLLSRIPASTLWTGTSATTLVLCGRAVYYGNCMLPQLLQLFRYVSHAFDVEQRRHRRDLDELWHPAFRRSTRFARASCKHTPVVRLCPTFSLARTLRGTLSLSLCLLSLLPPPLLRCYWPEPHPV